MVTSASLLGSYLLCSPLYLPKSLAKNVKEEADGSDQGLGNSPLMTIPRPGDEAEIAFIESTSEGTMATFERGGTPHTAGTLAPGNHQTVTTSDERDTGEGAVRE